MAINNDTIGIVLFVFAISAVISNVLSVVLKLCKDFTNPKLWKYSLIYQDIAYSCLSIGLVFFFINHHVDNSTVCDAAGFFLLFGISLCLLSYITTGIILLSVQNPGKSSSISNFHRKIVIVIVTPEVILSCVLSCLPYLADELYDKDLPFDISCFPIRDHGKQGAAYGTLLIVIWWLIIIATCVCDVISVLKLWKFNNRINTAQNNVWQALLISQGKVLVIVCVIEHVVNVLVLFTTTLAIYVNVTVFTNNKTWMVVTSLVVSVIVHSVVSNICNMMWTTCCCRDNSAVKEPHRKLKKLELINIETTGKIRMKATWTIGKHATKRGLMKVYGTNHLKSWAQEIVMLGMLRRIQHPSLIQCLWTNSSNPYYETMTLISGEIITSDSRIICLELTNGGTLHDFLQKVELPLPEQCQRMIVHDVAEGLFYLHHENILHNNLTTSCVYLKGSLQSMVLRAAVGDFEEAHIYGTLQQSLDNSLKDKRHFFLPDIRSFALIALEVVTKMSEKRFQNRYTHYSADHVPLKLNLTSVISDEEDEFQAQYSYHVEDTHRMFHAVHDNDGFSSDESGDNFQIGRKENGSLANLTSPRRVMSPAFDGRDLSTPDTVVESDNEKNVNDDMQNQTNSASIFRSKNKKKQEAVADEFSNTNCEMSKVNSKKHVSKSKLRTADGSDISSRKSVPPNISVQLENGRCVSPDPMKDETLQKLRKETKTSGSLHKKERKFSFSRKKSEEEIFKNGKIEAFVRSDTEMNEKRKDGKWLAKPTSILKSITSNDTTVSVFKAKPTDEESHLDAIEEEDISPGQTSFPRQVKVKEAKANKAEVWDIIDEQYYTQVNRKAMNNLKKTVSGESRSSLWSFISTPEDLDEDEMDDILDCLPGMADTFEYRKPEITVSDIMAERDNAKMNESSKKKFNFANLSKSKFELIDYYEMLKSKQITMDDIPEDKREMLINVVELKLEEKRKKDSAVKTVIRSDEMYDNNMSPGNNNSSNKVKIVSFRNSQVNSQPQRNEYQKGHDPRLERARSAPLKRSRTPVVNKSVSEKTPEHNPVFQDTKAITYAKRNRARAALRRAIHNKGKQSVPRQVSERGQTDLAVKYATVRKVVACTSDTENDPNESELITVPVPTSESFSVTNHNTRVNNVKRYSSFSSNGSGSTLSSSERSRPADTSLTSGELSSLSSQADSDHYDTDYHMANIEKLSANRKMIPTPSSKVDSGFDSSSISSEMSDAFTNRKLHLNAQFQIGSNKGIVDSWARNYKMIDGNFETKSNDFVKKPTVVSLQEQMEKCENVHDNKYMQNLDRGGRKDVIQNEKAKNVRNRKRAIPHRQKEPGSLNISPYTTISSRPEALHSRSMSPPSRVMSPVGRPVSPSRSLSPLSTRQHMSNSYDNSNKTTRPMSPDARPMSPKSTISSRPMSPMSRPMSPNVQPTNNRSVKTALSKTMSSTTVSPPTTGHSKQFSPGRKLSRPISPEIPKTNLDTSDISDTVSVAESSTSKASKRYREFVMKGVPLRTSVVDANPDELGEEANDLNTRPATAESLIEDQPDDQELFENLAAKGFFETKPRSRSPSPNKKFTSGQTPNSADNKPNSKNGGTRRRKKKHIPLEEIVRESPIKAHRSPSENHLTVTDEAILNQPTSEDSETCSIKTNKSSASSPSGSKPKLMIDAELVIDRIFSQNQHENNELDVEIEAALGLDKDPFKAVKEMYLMNDPCDTPNLNEIPLLNGVNQKHLHECIEMASGLHVLSIRDLLPASQESFQALRNKLQQVGQLGTVANQLLDVIQTCWLLDMPPTSGDLVEQLTDPVTETEL